MNLVDNNHSTNMCPAFEEVSGIVQMERAAVDKDLRRR